MRLPLSVALICALSACASADEARTAPGEARDLAPPAEVGSGEPNLSTAEDAVVLSWLEAAPTGGHDLWVSTLSSDGSWSVRTSVVHDDSLFVNWADFPSVVTSGDGALWAHWLRRTGGPGLAYDIRVSHSSDGGATWSEPWTPHEDGTATEHGFVTLLPSATGVELTWLDGRGYAPGPDGSEPAQEMSVRTRSVDGSGTPTDEIALDTRTCDCCQTDAAQTADGTVVVVYRNRTEDEIRDIYVTRRTAAGWTEGVPVHADGWNIGGCPVNGPAVGARGNRVAVAWFTAAGDVPQVYVAFSDDSGATFGTPVQVDGGNPAGRVDLRLREDGSALVSWLERVSGEGAELRLGHFEPSGAVSPPRVVSTSSSARAAGFPRMVLAPWNPDQVILAWTDVSVADAPRVRVQSVELTPS